MNDIDDDIRPGETVRVTATGQTFMVSEVVAVVRTPEAPEMAVADVSGRWFRTSEIERPDDQPGAEQPPE
jgi:hypothetical protein